MEGLQKALKSVPKESTWGPSSTSSYSDKPSFGGLSSDQSRVMVLKAPSQAVSVWTCSKMCAVCFIAGVVVGFTLKRRVRNWASKLLRKLKDD